MNSTYKPLRVTQEGRGYLSVPLPIGFLVFTFVTLLKAQVPPFEWVRQAGGTYTDVGSAVAADSAGNIYVTGVFDDIVTFGNDTFGQSGQGAQMFVSKFGATGNFLWTRAASISSQRYENYAAGKS